MLLLGKALSGGLFPISCVLADNSIMKHMKPGMHGSTFAGNPLSAAVAKASVEYTITRNLPQNSQKYGLYFRSELQRIMSLYPYIRDIRGKGLMNAIECENEKTASRLVNVLRHNNILTKTTHATTLRMTPPLVISQNELDESLGEIEKSFKIV
jgi:ornithine--oxo-acid transaminase